MAIKNVEGIDHHTGGIDSKSTIPKCFDAKRHTWGTSYLVTLVSCCLLPVACFLLLFSCNVAVSAGVDVSA